jgi:hypothetical protein
MPLAAPVIDNRRYQQLLDELLARVPVHTPDWTNFNHSDPGVTLVQLFAFLAESVIYRANLIPERNRAKFLDLLGVPLAPASPARGLVAITNATAAPLTVTLPGDIEVRADSVPFRSDLGLDVLPVEAQAFFKRPVPTPPAGLVDYYTLLYASYQQQMPLDVALYEGVTFDGSVVTQVDLHADTVDRSLWIALFGRKGDVGSDPADPWRVIREQLGGRTLTLGMVPALDAVQISLPPGGTTRPGGLLAFEVPSPTADGKVPLDANGQPAPSYRTIDPRAQVDVLSVPGIVQLSLPAADQIGMWTDLAPLEAGVGDLPPALDDATLAERLITWLRIRATGAGRASLLWVGINAATVTQMERISGEPLPDGDGTPDQTRRLAHAPLLARSVEIETLVGTDQRQWQDIADLMQAGPEVPVVDDRQSPGAPPPTPAPTYVFVADYEAGVLTFGDGLHGRRLPISARVFASYEFCQGSAGNVAPLTISTAPTLPSGFVVSNPVRSWGGADAENEADGEKQVRRYLQHRDRLVSAADFESIAWRAPSADVGRIEVLSAFHPDLVPNEPGAAPGVVTVMAIPRLDPGQPDAPRADSFFLNALCSYLDPRRLVTTELILRGPTYKGIWISVGIDVAAGFSVADVTDAANQQLRAFLSPIAPAAQAGFAIQASQLFGTSPPDSVRGWPLRTAVSSRVLLAEVARVAGVVSVADVLLAEGTSAPADTVEMSGLELPRILGISVVTGDPVPIVSLRGDALPGPGGAPPPKPLLPIPVVPENCQ